MSLICPECADHRHATCDRYHDVADRCGCDHPHHDEPDDDGHGDTQWADPGEAGGYEGVTW